MVQPEKQEENNDLGLEDIYDLEQQAEKAVHFPQWRKKVYPKKEKISQNRELKKRRDPGECLEPAGSIPESAQM